MTHSNQTDTIRHDAPVELAPGSPVGLVAGWGRFPITVAEKLQASGHRVVCVAITGHAGEEIEAVCDRVLWSGVGRFGKHLRFFKREQVHHVTMAGKLFKSDLLYGGSLLLRHLPDLTCVRTFGPLLIGRNKDARDDRLLTAVIDTYQNNQIEICSATSLAPELLVKPGQLTRRTLSPGTTRDAHFGWQIAKTMGGLDIGQAVAIKDGTVIAVEAIEGTDACIARAGQLCKRGGWTLVKVSKPNQDMRFDVPTIGTQTVQNVADAGGVAIAIEADRTILLDHDDTIRLADRLGVAIVSISADQVANANDATRFANAS
ncbi:hypothetical protein SAMN06265222_12438 [Neorhodopirellula lusitana]|uniref:DUF1009 domain-containing protein n=1 Tax=Neorhodopirellula lusitana TaxID=445327 RepID=A0ABY1QU69_9BACT|nr:UDP-2,3-diacylglucosamine diphosphatase LpxI [Neorhodopirellula lusitana]SMP78039.1 hypothetical protein SAMN06265222_12438 [Neorhodopirellula lusitana]